MRKNDKERLTKSHKSLYTFLGVYLFVALFGVAADILLFATENAELAVRVLISLFTYAGVCGSVGTSFYSAKAKAENEVVLQNARYEQRLGMAERVFTDIESGKVDKHSIGLVRMLISDNYDGSEAVNTSLPSDNITTDNSHNYSIDDILSEVSDGMG